MATKTKFDLKLSKSGNDRCIAGSSSGGIAAFNAAWERPEAFSRVYANSGSFVAFRGGHELATAPAYQPLRERPDFQRLLERLRASAPVIGRPPSPAPSGTMNHGGTTNSGRLPRSAGRAGSK